MCTYFLFCNSTIIVITLVNTFVTSKNCVYYSTLLFSFYYCPTTHVSHVSPFTYHLHILPQSEPPILVCPTQYQNQYYADRYAHTNRAHLKLQPRKNWGYPSNFLPLLLRLLLTPSVPTQNFSVMRFTPPPWPPGTILITKVSTLFIHLPQP